MVISEIADKNQSYFPYMPVASLILYYHLSQVEKFKVFSSILSKNLVFIFMKYLLEQILNLRQLSRYLKAVIFLKTIIEQALYLIQNKIKKIKKMPSDVKSLGIDSDHYKHALQYSFDKLAFEMYVHSVKTGLDCIFSLTYVMPLVWNTVIILFPFIEPTSEFQRGFMFLLIDALKAKFIDVPIALYETFVIEEKYGYNKKTLMLFFNDLVIEAALSVIIIPAVLYGYIYVVDQSMANEQFFFNVEIFVICVTLAIIIIYPNIIAPLFNEFEELKDGELKQDINDLAKTINFPLRNILIMNGSKRSDHSNAYFFGLWNYKRIVLYDTLLRQMSQNEIMAVVGHEFGHWKHQHSKINFLIYCARILILFSLYSYFRNSDSIFLSFGFSDKSTFIGTALFFNLFAPINSVIEIISLVITRYFEFQADIYSCNQGYGYYLMSGLTKIQKENVSTLNPDPWYAWFKYSHPGLFERLKRIKQRLYQIEKENGLENKQIQEKIQNFLEEHVSYTQKNQNIQNESNNYISPSSKKKQLGSQYQGFIQEHGNQLNQINNISMANSLINILDRNNNNNVNNSIQYPKNSNLQINHPREFENNNNLIGYQKMFNNSLNLTNHNQNNGFNLNLLFNFEQQQKQQQQYLMQQYNFQNLQTLKMQQQLWQDQQKLLNQLTTQSYFQKQSGQNQNEIIQLNGQQQQSQQSQNIPRQNSQHSNSSSSYILNNRKQYKNYNTNIESVDSYDQSSSVDIDTHNKKLYKEDVYLFGSNYSQNEIRKRQNLENCQSQPQSPPDDKNKSKKNQQNNDAQLGNQIKQNLSKAYQSKDQFSLDHNQSQIEQNSPSLSVSSYQNNKKNGQQYHHNKHDQYSQEENKINQKNNY